MRPGRRGSGSGHAGLPASGAYQRPHHPRLDASAPARGVPSVICDAERSRGAPWNRDGVIIFAATSRDPLYRVDPGGRAKPLTQLDRASGEFTHRWPWFLPDGKHFLYMAETPKNGVTTY